MIAGEKLRRRFTQLDTHADVIRCMQQTIRKLRALEVSDQFLDPIRINKAKVMVSSLSKLAELISTAGITLIPDEALIAEVVRRRDARLEHTPLRPPAEQ